MAQNIPKIMYDQTQYTPLYIFGPNGVWIEESVFNKAKKISGHAPEGWICYTQNKPESFWFGAYPQETLDKEAEVGFKNFTNDDFLKEFEDVWQSGPLDVKNLTDEYVDAFYGKEKESIKSIPQRVGAYLRKLKETINHHMSYYLLTQPQRFSLFESELKKFPMTKELEKLSTSGKSLTFVSHLRKAVLEYATLVRDSGLSYEEFADTHPHESLELKKVIDSYGYLTRQLFGGEFTDSAAVRKEIESLLKDPQLFEEEKRKMDELAANVDFHRELVSSADDDAMKLAHLMGHASVLRFDIQTSMMTLLKHVDAFAQGVQELHNLSKDEMDSYYYHELIDLIENGKKVPSEELTDRQKGFLRVFSSEGSKTFVGDQARSEIKDLLEHRLKDIETTKEVKGTIASWPDKSQKVIIARAFVMTTAFGADSTIRDFKEGDIMVATQTHPNLVPEMKKAVGIVTDEGGITCHAAIVSRELHKACIIGTKLSTKIFKTGDMLEMNMEKGTVRKAV